MGALGMGVFDDDTSCDIIEDAIGDETTIQAMVERSTSIDESEYLEYDDCHQIIVSAAMVDSLLNGASHCKLEGAGIWLSRQDPNSIAESKMKLVSLLKRVIGPNSELNELWEENEDDYPEWKGNIQGIITSLSS